MKVTLAIIALNEIEGMKAIMPTIPKGLFHQILVIDGKSTDRTAEWSREQGYDVHVQHEKGIRHAYIEGFPLITGDYVLTFSPDGNCKTEDIPLILSKLAEGYDMVIASRYFGGIKSEDDSALTAFGNWMFTGLINLMHGGHYTDAMTIYRAYRTKLFYELNLHKHESYKIEKMYGTVMGIEPLLSIRAAKHNLKVAEVPSIEPPRIYGQRKLQIFRWGASYLSQIFLEKFNNQ